MIPVSIPLDNCELNPDGVEALRNHLGRDERYLRFQERFDTADLAWFVAGAHRDGRHTVAADHFHPDFHTARQGTGTGTIGQSQRGAFRSKLMSLVFDSVRNFSCFISL